MDSNLTNCFVCLSPNILHKFGVFGKRKKVATTGQLGEIDDCRCVDNQVQVIFLLKKMLEIPNGVCHKFFQEYGNPCSWIYCCDSCSVLVDEARNVFNEMAVLQKKFEKLQMDLKKGIVDSVNSQVNPFCINLQNRPNIVVRAYVSKELNGPSTEPRIKIEAEEAEDMDVKSELDFLDWSSVDTSDDDNADEDYLPTRSLYSNPRENSYNNTLALGAAHSNGNSEHGDVNESGEKYSCDICSEDFNGQRDLLQHRLMHSGIKRLHECHVCQKRFTQSGSLKIHYRIHSALAIPTEESGFVPQVFNCEFCKKEYADYDTFNSHLKTHANNELFKCEVCGEEFNEPQLFMEHSKKMHEKEIVIHFCAICQNVFPDTTTLNVHMKCHSAENSFPCDICGVKFSSSRDLNVHLQTHPKSLIDPYKCKICRQKFMQKHLLTFHEKREHELDMKMYSCKICNKNFVSKEKLERHMVIHSDKKPFQCKICHRNFISANSLKSHTKSHNVGIQSKFNCNFCGATFKQLNLLNNHIAQLHPPSSNPIPIYVEPAAGKEEQTFLCFCCGNMYRDEKDLKEHVKSHLGQYPYMCEHCGKHFIKTHGLKIHLRDHTGERPFQCNFCEKNFKQAVSLILHRRTHTGEKPYKCDMCEKAFAQSSHLDRHKRSRHENK